jgi:uncharacterized DUF497 family protein
MSIQFPTVRYEWDPAKAAANLEAHRVSFSEAVTVFSDDFALTREDPQAAGDLRVISAWKANRRQRLDYEKNHP